MLEGHANLTRQLPASPASLYAHMDFSRKNRDVFQPEKELFR